MRRYIHALSSVPLHIFSRIYANYTRLLALLPALHPDKGNKLQQHLHMPRAERQATGKPDDRMRQLRLSRMFFQRLGTFTNFIALSNRYRTLREQWLQHPQPHDPLRHLDTSVLAVISPTKGGHNGTETLSSRTSIGYPKH